MGTIIITIGQVFNCEVKSLRFRVLNANYVFYNCVYACAYCITHVCCVLIFESFKTYSQLSN